MDMPNSAQSLASIQSYPEFTENNYWASDSGVSSIANWFTGYKTAQQDKYNKYLTENERAYELAKINDARAWEYYLDSNKYSMAVKDLKNAGLNPWLAVQNGLSGSNSGSTTSNSASSSSSSATKLEKNSKKDSNSNSFKDFITTALKLATLVAIAG